MPPQITGKRGWVRLMHGRCNANPQYWAVMILQWSEGLPFSPLAYYTEGSDTVQITKWAYSNYELISTCRDKMEGRRHKTSKQNYLAKVLGKGDGQGMTFKASLAQITVVQRVVHYCKRLLPVNFAEGSNQRERIWDQEISQMETEWRQSNGSYIIVWL